ncbi:hypothetical protein SISNIDRAFT_446203 [Sistotremastrum niveocremeum HHB9708]|uniref:SH3 domain-containing protein n=2 Tax=Sistotremastraceae TaxID=3402574 RepID=A0A164NZT3_9AGAM|nr:hypothetical protein SISNIDRAFT_446203 [Sistotremastrum niveocremeum HHB9708]KZT36536.1 hypothetical protein SISSUDRAFT_1130327 [Sistotremastrum suecicum HHB10207 ss-3]
MTEGAPRRQASTTSLSKYVRDQPSLENRSMDFCNAFWGLGDGGVDVLLARMRGSSRTMEELRSFWKERMSIEEEYSKKLNKLAKMQFGRDEIGDLRNSIDTLRLETDKQATSHLELAAKLKADMEVPTAAFVAKQVNFKKTFVANIERMFKNKQNQESHVAKAKEKYELECSRINAHTAHSSYIQGKELDKVQLKLEKAQAAVKTSEKEYANFVRVLKDTYGKWEKEWKEFCDRCQDIEEERIEFMKDNLWSYANAISTVCVADDESCEHTRVALEQLETERDMENFVRDYGTGSNIPEPPPFINHSSPEPRPAASRPRNANFARSTQRPVSLMISGRGAQPEDDEPPTAGNAGIGAGGVYRDSTPSRSQSRASLVPDSMVVNGVLPSSIFPPSTSTAAPVNVPSYARDPSPSRGPVQPTTAAGSSSFTPVNETQTEPLDAKSGTKLKIGSNAYEVDPSKDPQGSLGRTTSVRTPASSSRGRPTPAPAPGASNVGGQDDPLFQTMQQLQKDGSVNRRPTLGKQTPAASSSSSSNLVAPSSTSSSINSNLRSRNSVDYSASAESIVGPHPSSATTSRPTSPAPPTAVMMQPARPVSSSPVPVEEVVSSYGQRFPDEQRSQSRNSRTRDSLVIGQSSGPATLDRPVSPGGHVGVGAHGRSSSPQPAQHPVFRPTSPQPPQNRPASANSMGYANPGASEPSSAGGRPSQSASVSSLGIALSADGRVSVDSMRDRYTSQQQQQPQMSNPILQQRPPQQQPGQAPSGYYPQNPAGSQAYPGAAVAAPSQSTYPQPTQSQVAGRWPPQHSPVRRPTYSNPHSSGYVAPMQPQQQEPPQAQYPAYPAAQPPYGYEQPQTNGIHRAPSATGYQNPVTHYPPASYGPPQPTVVQSLQQPVHNNIVQQRAPSPAPATQVAQPPPQPQRSPSPYAQPDTNPTVPTGAFTDEGQGILFYVKALYDYQATTDEEFDFQAGDVIAVTQTPEDGWWSGVLLDDTRRMPGRTVFPSNFVTLF